MMRRLKAVMTSVFAVAALLIFSGCTSTYQGRKVEPSGFLTHTEQLAKGKGSQAKLVYIDSEADFSKYTKILLEPIAGYGSTKGRSIKNLDERDQKKLLNYFDAALRQELSKSFELVDQTGPDVLKLRVAVTDARGSKVVLDTVSSVIPIGIAASTVKAVATGKHLSVGDVGAEMEVLDSQNGRRLAAAVDVRVGRKYTLKFDKFSKWRTAKDAFDYWAETIHLRLRELSKQ
ncbi:MAG: DUF3313 domain-containing protein [Lentisphaeria bacterium]|nr:DUF3313 domain-containing protein [Lentisphaeria bacterium]